MHFAIDVRQACVARRTGKGQWTYGFTEELLTRGHQVTLLSDAPIPEHWSQFAHHTEIFPPGIRWHWNAARYLRATNTIDVYISPTSFIVPAFMKRTVHVIPVVHDLIAFNEDRHEMKATLVERLTLRPCLRHSRYVLVPSLSTKRDLLSYFSFLQPESVTVVSAGPLRDHTALNVPDGRTILCPATLCPRKNQKRLLLAYRMLDPALRAQYQLVLIGARGWHDQDIIDLVAETDGVTWLDYVPDAEYERLLHTCEVLALPSLYEGFGIQVLDALQRGIPVLTSERGSLHEVAGSCAVVVQPENIEDIARGLTRILTDASLRASLRKQGPIQAAQFTWKKTVDAFFDAIAKMPW